MYFRHKENAGTHRRNYIAALALIPVVVCRRLREILMVLRIRTNATQEVGLPDSTIDL
jgi:hypothetical protein